MADAPTHPDGSVKLPEELEHWLEAFFTPGQDDSAWRAQEDRNVAAVTLWTLLYSQTIPDIDRPARQAIRSLLDDSSGDRRDG